MKGFLKKLVYKIPSARIRSVTRISMELELKKHLNKFPFGKILDVGSKESPYKKFISFKEYVRLDISPDSNPDVLGDLHSLNLKKGSFDGVLATEVLEHLYDPGIAISEIYRILKKEGVCIITTRFFYHYHPDPKDYYRFTWDSLNYLFRDFSSVEIFHHGNYIQTLWQMINTGKFGIILNFFNPLFARITSKKTKYPLGFVVVAKK